MKQRSDLARYEGIYERIRKHYGRGEALPVELQSRVDRWKTARTYLLQDDVHTDYQVVQYLVEDCKVSEAVAWQDVRDTRRYFSQVETVNDEFGKIKLRMQIEQLANTTTKDAVRAQCHRNLIELGGYNKPQPEEGTTKQIIMVIGTDPRLVGAKPIANLQKIVEKFIGEKHKRELMIEDTDFEMVADGGKPA
jgi:hypothetical protein